MAIEQRVELRPQRGETAGLDLDEFAVRAHEVDHVAVDPYLEGVAGRRPEAPSARGAAGLRAACRSRRKVSSIVALDLWPGSVHTAAHGYQNRFWNMEERVTIRELARRSGVSVGTVSRALNGYTDVRPETRERIMRLASRARLHAGRRRPQPGHPALARHRRVHGDRRGPSRPPAPVLPRGPRRAQAARRRRGLRPAAVRLRASRRRLRPALLPQARPPPQRRRLRADRARPRRTRRCAGWCARRSPASAIDMQLEGPRTEVVDVRQRGRRGARPCATCTSLGHRRIATVTGMIDSRPGIDRLRGYRAAIQELDLAYRDEYVALRRLLRRVRPRGDGAPAGAAPSRRRRSSRPRT